MNEHRKRALKNEVRYRERLQLLGSMPFSADVARELFDHLDTGLSSNACQHDLRLTKAWCASAGIDESVVSAWLEELGAFCDCEVLGSVEDQVHDALKGTM